MYELILVDDQEITIQTLSTLYDWESFGFHLAAVFTDGEDAMHFLKNHPVDLVISDIKMPCFSGLDLANFCHVNFPDTLFILFSAYRDFKYAQEALKYNVINYITKPIDFSLLEQAIVSAYEKINTAKQNASCENTMAFQQHFFSHLFENGMMPTKQVIVSEMQNLQIDPDILNKECVLITVQFDEFAAFMNSIWKYGIERFYNAVSFLFPKEKDLFHFIVIHSFDTAKFVCFNAKSSSAFSGRIQSFLTTFERNITENLHLKIKYIHLQYALSFTGLYAFIQNDDMITNTKSTIEQAINYIEDNYDKSISLNDVAAFVHLHPTYFSTFFKQHTGINFSDYLQKARISKALEYLRTTDFPVTTICEMVGYKNTTRFYNMVRAEFHMSATEYRAHWKEKEYSNE